MVLERCELKDIVPLKIGSLPGQKQQKISKLQGFYLGGERAAQLGDANTFILLNQVTLVKQGTGKDLES